MTETQIRQDVGKFYNYLSRRDAKYRRNFNRYCNNGARRSDIYNLYDNPLSFLYSGTQTQEDIGVLPIINVIRSAIETLVSKVSQTKVRPFFNPVNGTYKTRKVCRAAQVFFDEFFDDQHVYHKAVQALRDACIFEVGYLWANDDDNTIERLAPWEYYFDPAEYNFGKITRCYIRRTSYPANQLRGLKGGKDKINALLADDIGAKCEYVIFYDLIDKEKHHIVNGDFISKTKIDYDVPPVSMLYYSPPVKGAFSTSLADNLYTIQRQIDTISERIHAAVELSPGMQIFLPKGSDIKASQYNNEVGAIWQYTPLPQMGSSPVTFATPKPIDPQYIQLLELFEQRAYQMEGISQLSAQSKKPSGLNSGVALQTLEDVESERHNVILSQFIKFLMDIASLAIAIFPNTADVLPARVGRSGVKWADVKREREMYNIQFSASSSLSKDPKTKMEQLEKLLQMGVIDPDMAASLLEFPDLEDAYSVATASYDDAQKIIERAIEDGDVDYYECVNLKQLYREIVNTILRLDASDESPKVLGNLVSLLTKVKADVDMIQEAANPPAPAPAPMPVPAAPMAPPLAGAPIPGATM